MPMNAPSKEMLDCMKTCGECAGMCGRCAHHCLGLGGDHASQRHQGIMHDCAAICGLAACFMSRNSPHAPHVCRECAEICDACAASCEQLANGDAMMLDCAKTCRQCAQVCRSMAK